MKILCCIESYLPGEMGGGPVRALSNLVAQLSDQHEFFILTRNHDYLDSKVYPHIESNRWITGPGGVQIFYASDSKWKQALVEASEQLKADWIYLQGALAPMTRQILSARKGNKVLRECKILLAPHGNLSPAALQRHAWRKRLWLFYARFCSLYEGVSWHVASTREFEQVHSRFGTRVDIRKIPMAPPTLDFPKQEEGGKIESIRPNYDSGFNQSKDCLRLVYFGRLSPEKNLEFAFERLSEFAMMHPDTQVSYDLIGSGNSIFVAQLKTLAGRMSSNLQINFIGQLSSVALRARLCSPPTFEDGSSELRCGYAVMLMPSRTENFSYTILESLQAGIPVLISDQTPWRDLQEKGIGWDFCLDEKKLWQDALLALSNQSEDQNSQRSLQAREYANKWVAQYQAKAQKLFRLD